MLNRDIVENKFKIQFHCYIHFQAYTLGKGMNPPAMGYIASLLFFYKDGLGI